MAINRFVKVGGNSQRRRSPITCMKLFIAIAGKQILIWPYRHDGAPRTKALHTPVPEKAASVWNPKWRQSDRLTAVFR